MVRVCDHDGIVGLKKHFVNLVYGTAENRENYPWEKEDIERRLSWMDAAECMGRGDLETSARMLVHGLSMFDAVFPGEQVGYWGKCYR